MIRKGGFYSTYEELKQKYGDTIKRHELGFYSTYEELKHASAPAMNLLQNLFLQYLWGIETGYKRQVANGNVRVFTVPMRNWNYYYFIKTYVLYISFYSTYEELKHLNWQIG